MRNKLNKDGFITIGMENIMSSIEEVALLYRSDITDGNNGLCYKATSHDTVKGTTTSILTILEL